MNILNNLNEKKQEDIIIRRLNTNKDLTEEENDSLESLRSSKSKESNDNTVEVDVSIQNANVIKNIYSKFNN